MSYGRWTRWGRGSCEGYSLSIGDALRGQVARRRDGLRASAAPPSSSAVALAPTTDISRGVGHSPAGMAGTGLQTSAQLLRLIAPVFCLHVDQSTAFGTRIGRGSMMRKSFEKDGFSVTAWSSMSPSGEVRAGYDIQAVTDEAKNAFRPEYGAIEGFRGAHEVRPTGISFGEKDGLDLAERQAGDLIEVMLRQSGYNKFELPVTFRRQTGSLVYMSHTKAGLDFLESLPDEQKIGINFEASLGSLHRAHITGDPSDLRQARRDLEFLVTNAPGL